MRTQLLFIYEHSSNCRHNWYPISWSSIECSNTISVFCILYLEFVSCFEKDIFCEHSLWLWTQLKSSQLYPAIQSNEMLKASSNVYFTFAALKYISLHLNTLHATASDCNRVYIALPYWSKMQYHICAALKAIAYDCNRVLHSECIAIPYWSKMQSHTSCIACYCIWLQ